MKIMTDTIATLRAEAFRELTEHLLPYWADRTIDRDHGGFVGQITGDNVVNPHAPKGAVLNARLLWTFSAAARVLDDARYRPLADRAYAYLLKCFWDPVNGGVFWMIDHKGVVLNPKKQTYAQAFAIYGLAEYYRLTGEPQSLERAITLFELLEQRAADPMHGGYFEAFSRKWSRLLDERLSSKDPLAAKSTNTLLHVLEAYTTLYRVWPTARLRASLTALIRCFLDVIIDAGTHHLASAFDAQWHPVSDVVSFGHDIEAAWLLTEAAETISEADLLAEVQDKAVRMTEVTLRGGTDDDGGLFNEATPSGLLDDDKHWWPQAEAVVGFVNAFQITQDERFLQAALHTWAFIQRTLVDARHGEWFFRVSRTGRPYDSEDKVGPWKCPYHNVRACLEVMTRTDKMAALATG